MRNIILIVVLLLYSCCFIQQSNSNKGPLDHDSDSIFLLAKEQGKGKSANGEEQGFIVVDNQANDTCYDNSGKACIGQLDHAINADSIFMLAYKYKKRGNEKSANGDEEGAIEDYTRAIKIKPTYDTCYYNRGVGKAFLGRNKDAIIDYNEALKINPNYARAYNGRANSKRDMGDKEGALADYSRAIEISKDFVDAYVNRGVLKGEMKDYEGELSDYRLAIKYCEPDVDVYNNLGGTLYNLGCDFNSIERFKESAEAYGEGIKYFPKDYRLYYGRGLARKRTGDKKGACEDWIKCSELGCMKANVLLLICDECIKERNDSLRIQKEEANQMK